MNRTLAAMLVLPCLLCLARAVPAQEKKAQDKKVEILEERYDDTGKPMERREVYRNAEGEVVNHGQYTYWFPNGNKSYEVVYKDGKRNGKQTNYHFTGGKSSEQTFVDGKIEGKEPWWDENGKLYREYEYKLDTPHGTWVWWYDKEGKGTKTAEATWKEGLKDGPYRWWHDNGQLGVEGVYKENKQQGTWKYWDRDGKLTETREYKDGELAKPAK